VIRSAGAGAGSGGPVRSDCVFREPEDTRNWRAHGALARKRVQSIDSFLARPERLILIGVIVGLRRVDLGFDGDGEAAVRRADGGTWNADARGDCAGGSAMIASFIPARRARRESYGGIARRVKPGFRVIVFRAFQPSQKARWMEHPFPQPDNRRSGSAFKGCGGSDRVAIAHWGKLRRDCVRRWFLKRLRENLAKVGSHGEVAAFVELFIGEAGPAA